MYAIVCLQKDFMIITLTSFQYDLKGTYYENNTFPGIWGVVLGLWCSNMDTNFEKSLHDFF